MYYVLIKSSATDIVASLFLSTKCFNGGKLIWNVNASPRIIAAMLINTKYKQYTTSKTWYLHVNWHDFELQAHKFILHIMPKGAHNPLWRKMLMMTGISLIFAITVAESILQLCANVFIDWNCVSYERCDPWVSFCFYSRSTGPSSTKLGTKHYRVMRIQIYSNEMSSLFQGKNNSKK